MNVPPIYKQALMTGAAAAMTVLAAHLTAQLQAADGGSLDHPNVVPASRLKQAS